MTESIRAIRGMNDVLPDDTLAWQHVEDVARRVLEQYGYRNVRLPLLEFTDLFRRSIGEVTDIVEKEMYTFDDRNGESLTLRPEATAGVVRAAITNGLLHNQRHKFWTAGPMFRYEKPQAGRYRQFHQIDAEAIGFAGPDVDAELILSSARLLRELGIDRVRLELNSLGTAESRAGYRDALVEYFEAHRGALDADSARRLGQNPLRILDSKNPDMAELVDEAPRITDFLDPESRDHFESLQRYLDDAGIAFTINPRLVRGLDYYSRTVFEWITDALGAQGAVLSGGRYDGLIEQLGGRPTPAVGWAAGLERLVALYRTCSDEKLAFAPEVYIVAVGDGAEARAMGLAEALRDELGDIDVLLNLAGGSFKAQLKRADRSGARFAIVIGENELAAGRAGLKPLRSDEAQREVPFESLAAELRASGVSDRVRAEQ